MRAVFWWVDRWRKSTAYLLMNAEEQGLYRNLLDTIWTLEGPIPNDPRVMATASGGDAIAWERSGEKVLKWFRLTDKGWVNDTALEVLDKTRHLQSVRSVAGKAGAVARWQPRSKGNGKAMAK